MFDIGWTELVVIAVVACLVLDHQDLQAIIKAVRNGRQSFSVFMDEAKTLISEINQDQPLETKKILDLDGNEQIAYDLNDLRPDIKENKSGS